MNFLGLLKEALCAVALAAAWWAFVFFGILWSAP
jgi:hypothetical protein